MEYSNVSETSLSTLIDSLRAFGLPLERSKPAEDETQVTQEICQNCFKSTFVHLEEFRFLSEVDPSVFDPKIRELEDQIAELRKALDDQAAESEGPEDAEDDPEGANPDDAEEEEGIPSEDPPKASPIRLSQTSPPPTQSNELILQLQEENNRLKDEICGLHVKLDSLENTNADLRLKATTPAPEPTGPVRTGTALSRIDASFPILEKIERFFEQEEYIPSEVEQFLSLRELEEDVRKHTRVALEQANEQLNVRVLMILQNFCDELERKGKQLDALANLISKGIQDSKVPFLPEEVAASLEVTLRKKDYLTQALENLKDCKEPFVTEQQSVRAIITQNTWN